MKCTSKNAKLLVLCRKVFHGCNDANFNASAIVQSNSITNHGLSFSAAAFLINRSNTSQFIKHANKTNFRVINRDWRPRKDEATNKTFFMI